MLQSKCNAAISTFMFTFHFNRDNQNRIVQGHFLPPYLKFCLFLVAFLVIILQQCKEKNA